MTKGEAEYTKVHLRGKNTKEDFIILISISEEEKREAYDKGRKEGFTTEILNQITSSNDFAIYETNKHGPQGHLNQASKLMLSSEFDTESHEECFKKILETGTLQESHMPERHGPKNDSQTTSIVPGQPGTR
ncbi:shwachman-Bodian-diamond syndrome protein [Xylariaceae sp. FL1272]|nr:shwachman-Bodian-diamond syndrome protein [Xylariaceae sp. FL1272]